MRIMRRIDKSCLAGMKSPVRCLMETHLGNSVFDIAPERSPEFDKALDNFDLIYCKERFWTCCADPKEREIYISRGTVELIWCASLAHFLFYSRFIGGKVFKQLTEIDPHADKNVAHSLLLLNWAIKCQLSGDTADDWPPEYPQPQLTPNDGAENAANELCLVSCAFLLHHELAHISGRHSDRGSSTAFALRFLLQPLSATSVSCRRSHERGLLNISAKHRQKSTPQSGVFSINTTRSKTMQRHSTLKSLIYSVVEHPVFVSISISKLENTYE